MIIPSAHTLYFVSPGLRSTLKLFSTQPTNLNFGSKIICSAFVAWTITVAHWLWPLKVQIIEKENWLFFVCVWSHSCSLSWSWNNFVESGKYWVYPSIYLFIYLPIYLSIYLQSICVSVCLSVLQRAQRNWIEACDVIALLNLAHLSLRQSLRNLWRFVVIPRVLIWFFRWSSLPSVYLPDESEIFSYTFDIHFYSFSYCISAPWSSFPLCPPLFSFSVTFRGAHKVGFVHWVAFEKGAASRSVAVGATSGIMGCSLCVIIHEWFCASTRSP